MTHLELSTAALPGDRVSHPAKELTLMERGRKREEKKNGVRREKERKRKRERERRGER